MNDIISWYNRNRKKLWVIVFTVIVIGFIVYRLIEGMSNNNQPAKNDEPQKIDTNSFNSVTMTNQESVISGNQVTATQKEISVIDSFISYCNSGNIQEAYNLLSEECKNEMYPEMQKFQDDYYKTNFNGQKKNVKIENWIGNIYRVNINEDMLATGRYEALKNKQDYITLTKDSEGNTKLNINKYIKRTQINKTISKEDVDITIKQKDTYVDYEYYTFEVKNNSKTAMALGNVQDTEATYLLDKNNNKFTAYMHEIAEPELIVQAGETKNIKIKYFNEYSSTRQITNLVIPRAELGQYNFVEFKFSI